jgi:hypothetical protein
VEAPAVTSYFRLVTIRTKLIFGKSGSKGFGVMRICSRTRGWPACVFHAADDTQFEFLFSAGCMTIWTIVSTIRCVRSSDSKMSTEVEGTLTRADAPQRGNAPHSAPHPACVYPALQ